MPTSAPRSAFSGGFPRSHPKIWPIFGVQLHGAVGAHAVGYNMLCCLYPFRAFHASKWKLCDKTVPIAQRLQVFDKMVTPVVCFAAGHRAIHMQK